MRFSSPSLLPSLLASSARGTCDRSPPQHAICFPSFPPPRHGHRATDPTRSAKALPGPGDRHRGGCGGCHWRSETCGGQGEGRSSPVSWPSGKGGGCTGFVLLSPSAFERLVVGARPCGGGGDRTRLTLLEPSVSRPSGEGGVCTRPTLSPSAFQRLVVGAGP